VLFFAAMRCWTSHDRERTSDTSAGRRGWLRRLHRQCERTQADLQSAIDGSSSICIEITADIDLVDGYDGYTALSVASGKNVRLWTSDGAVLNG